jgi:hypothetical protein
MDEICGACSTSRRKDECLQHFGQKAHLRDPGVDKRIVEKDLKKVRCDDVEWTDLAQDGDQWRDVVNTVTIIGVP